MVPTWPCMETDLLLNEQLVISIPAVRPIMMTSLMDTCIGAVTRSVGHLSASRSTRSKRTAAPQGSSIARQNETQAASPICRRDEGGSGGREGPLLRANLNGCLRRLSGYRA